MVQCYLDPGKNIIEWMTAYDTGQAQAQVGAT